MRPLLLKLSTENYGYLFGKKHDYYRILKAEEEIERERERDT